MTGRKVEKAGNPYYEANGAMFEELLRLVTENPFGYHKKIRRLERLNAWVASAVPALQPGSYTVATRCNWIFHGITGFPACEHCGKLFKSNMTVWKEYPRMCEKCNRIHNEELKAKRLETFSSHVKSDPLFTAKIQKKREATNAAAGRGLTWNNVGKARETRRAENGGSWHPSDFAERCRNGRGPDWTNRKKAMATCRKRYGSDSPFKSAEVRERISAGNLEKYGVENALSARAVREKIASTNMDRYGVANPFQAECVKRKIENTNIKRYGAARPLQNRDIFRKARQKYEMTCLKRYGKASYFSSDAFRKWCVENYGVENVMQNSSVRKAAAAKYEYESVKFDSAAELAYYVWLTDTGADFEYCPDLSFEYFLDGEKHLYFPDFIAGGEVVEIKGDHFFKEDGTMQNPFDHSQDRLYEAKRRCMVANGVRILRKAEYIKFIKYVEDKYGSNFLKSFRSRSSASETNAQSGL